MPPLPQSAVEQEHVLATDTPRPQHQFEAVTGDLNLPWSTRILIHEFLNRRRSPEVPSRQLHVSPYFAVVVDSYRPPHKSPGAATFRSSGEPTDRDVRQVAAGIQAQPSVFGCAAAFCNFRLWLQAISSPIMNGYHYFDRLEELQMKLPRARIGRTISGSASILGGVVWLVFWTFHTIAHGPSNPAPTDGTFLGYTSLEHAQLMMLIAPPSLVLGLLGMLQHEWEGLGMVGRAGLFCTLAALGAMWSVSTGLGSWAIYALSIVGLCLALVLLGVGTLRLKSWPIGSRWAPLATSIVLPLIVAARPQGQPPLGRFRPAYPYHVTVYAAVH